MECAVCGGTDFTAESGYYFCNECQTQTQEIKEHVFQEEVDQINITHAKKIRDATPKKNVEQITSWECWNVILMMLTEELINLGVDRSIKKIVRCLWMRYLEKLEVLHMQRDEKPKFSLMNMKRDVKIVYGVAEKKYRRKSVSSEETTGSMVSKRLRSSKKRALAKAQYNEQSKTDGSSSLHNETLTSLKSHSENSADKEIQFNKFGHSELKKIMSSQRIKRHQKEILSDTNRKRPRFSSHYHINSYHLSPSKIYCILHLALLIKKDPMQLGDMLRFMREGHLSFHCYSHLFPESYANKRLNIADFRSTISLSHHEFRKRTAELANLLDVCSYISCPDLVALARRYCEEMNLPDDIFLAVKNILAKNPPYQGTIGNRIPNYEGRVMAIIMFVLKLFFGLDDVSEINLSQFAKALNATWPNLKMFDILEWMEFINYRRVLINEYHFPSANENIAATNADLYMEYRKNHKIDIDYKPNVGFKKRPCSAEMTGYKDLLTKIIKLQNDEFPQIEYPPSVHPYKSHSDVIKSLLHRSDPDGIKFYMLTKYFQNRSMDFLFNPLAYLWQLNSKAKFQHGGLNDQWKLKTVELSSKLNFLEPVYMKHIPVEVVKHEVKREPKKKIEKDVSSKNIKVELKQFTKYHQYQFKEDLIELGKLSGRCTFNGEGRCKDDRQETYDLHCFPYERHWINFTNTRINFASFEQFQEYMNGFSSSFKMILKECSRITEQTDQELFEQFQSTELYLIYCSEYNGSNKRRELVIFKKFLQDIEKSW
ncbi:TATA box-binding protein-associated factor RNA polymerase I subunit B [Diabrotica undecimpunctata]|uniref:TATA box-binding protein-associated factor RNA polymerase I subunit B n=1 Tax=Diabrotica undecimpunctata TaxID=50387 RepID=UPI003B6346C6